MHIMFPLNLTSLDHLYVLVWGECDKFDAMKHNKAQTLKLLWINVYPYKVLELTCIKIFWKLVGNHTK